MTSIRVLSLGAGVQSSALLLMCDRGDVAPVDFAVFADTQAEPREVMEWLAKLQKSVRTEIVMATAGDIVADHLAHWRGEKKRVAQAPFYAKSTESNGMIRRHCTQDYKIRVVDRAIRERLGYKPRERWRHHVDLLLGISADEMQRMKVSLEKWKTLHYPLIDKNLHRSDCISYVEQAGLGTPPRSACFFCPYKSDSEWRKMRDENPEDWNRAVEFDEQIRTCKSPGLTSQFFVHRSRVPLAIADISKEERQMTFLDECDGMCGV